MGNIQTKKIKLWKKVIFSKFFTSCNWPKLEYNFQTCHYTLRSTKSLQRRSTGKQQQKRTIKRAELHGQFRIQICPSQTREKWGVSWYIKWNQAKTCSQKWEKVDERNKMNEDSIQKFKKSCGSRECSRDEAPWVIPSPYITNR